MALITFIRTAAPAASWIPTRNPNYGGGYERKIRRHQPISISDGGDVYSYGKGNSEGLVLKWSRMPEGDLTSLLAFFEDIAGARQTFAYTDPDGVMQTARLANANGLTYLDVGAGRYEVTLELEFS